MLPTIVFFLALFSSISLIITIFEYDHDRKEYIKLKDNTSKNIINDTSNVLTCLVFCTTLLWSWLYWLSH